MMIGLAVVAVLALGANAFSEWGMGYGHHGRGYNGPMHDGYHGGWGHRGGGHGCRYGRGDNNNLTENNWKQLNQERLAFQESVRDIRRKLTEKSLARESELAKENPDIAKVKALQKELSELEAQLKQKKLSHLLKMREISPNRGGMVSWGLLQRRTW